MELKVVLLSLLAISLQFLEASPRPHQKHVLRRRGKRASVISNEDSLETKRILGTSSNGHRRRSMAFSNCQGKAGSKAGQFGSNRENMNRRDLYGCTEYGDKWDDPAYFNHGKGAHTSDDHDMYGKGSKGNQVSFDGDSNVDTSHDGFHDSADDTASPSSDPPYLQASTGSSQDVVPSPYISGPTFPSSSVSVDRPGITTGSSNDIAPSQVEPAPVMSPAVGAPVLGLDIPSSQDDVPSPYISGPTIPSPSASVDGPGTTTGNSNDIAPSQVEPTPVMAPVVGAPVLGLDIPSSQDVVPSPYISGPTVLSPSASIDGPGATTGNSNDIASSPSRNPIEEVPPGQISSPVTSTGNPTETPILAPTGSPTRAPTAFPPTLSPVAPTDSLTAAPVASLPSPTTVPVVPPPTPSSPIEVTESPTKTPVAPPPTNSPTTAPVVPPPTSSPIEVTESPTKTPVAPPPTNSPTTAPVVPPPTSSPIEVTNSPVEMPVFEGCDIVIDEAPENIQVSDRFVRYESVNGAQVEVIVQQLWKDDDVISWIQPVYLNDKGEFGCIESDKKEDLLFEEEHAYTIQCQDVGSVALLDLYVHDGSFRVSTKIENPCSFGWGNTKNIVKYSMRVPCACPSDATFRLPTNAPNNFPGQGPGTGGLLRGNSGSNESLDVQVNYESYVPSGSNDQADAESVGIPRTDNGANLGGFISLPGPILEEPQFHEEVPSNDYNR